MPEPSSKVGLSTLLSHFEDGLGRGGDPDASAQVAAVRMRYSQGELGYTSALHELQGVVGRGALLEAARELNTGSTSRGDQPDAPPTANPTPKVEPTTDALQVLAEPETSGGRRDSGGSASDAPFGRSTVHPTGTFAEPGSLQGAAPWQGTFAFQQPGPPGNKEGKQSLAIVPPDGQLEAHSPGDDAELAMGAISPSKGNPVLRIDVNLEPAAGAHAPAIPRPLLHSPPSRASHARNPFDPCGRRTEQEETRARARGSALHAQRQPRARAAEAAGEEQHALRPRHGRHKATAGRTCGDVVARAALALVEPRRPTHAAAPIAAHGRRRRDDDELKLGPGQPAKQLRFARENVAEARRARRAGGARV